MPQFQYKAFQTDGTTAEGVLDAGGRQEAFRQMEQRGLKPITLAEKANGAPQKGAATASLGKSFRFQSKRVTPRMLENFTRLLSSLLAAGVPLSRALVILCKEATVPVAAAKWKQVYDSVVDGVSLADSMARIPDTFPRVYVAMVQAGETGGFLDLVLAQIADFQTRAQDLRAKVMAAMLYPAILLLMAIGVIIVLMTFFIPRFQTIFASMGGDLPLLTQIIVGVSHWIRHYGLFIGAGLVIAGFLLRGWVASEKGRRAWEGFILHMPILGPLLSQFAMARFCRMLGTLLNAGVPLIEALNVARKSIGNQILVDAVSNAIDRVKEGAQLGASMADCRTLFSGSILEMIAVAEESGKLDQELIRIAAVTESDLDRNLKTGVAVLEPVMLFCIAGFIGTIFIGMILPIFKMQDLIK
jgi:type II secretory pathway component PulF